MYAADCAWQPGMTNVDHQKYIWVIDGTEVASGQLQASENSRSSQDDGVTINPTNQVTFSVASVNQWGESDPAVATGSAPAPVPEGPSAVTMQFREVQQTPAIGRR